MRCPARESSASAALACSSTDSLSHGLGVLQLERTDEAPSVGEDALSVGSESVASSETVKDSPRPRPCLLALPLELLIRICAIDLGRFGRLSERIERETTLRSVCRVLADVVAAIEPSYRAERRYETLVLPGGPQEALDRLMLLKRRSGLLAGDVGALRRMVTRLMDPSADIAVAVRYFLCEVVALAKHLAELEVDLNCQAAPDGLVVDIARHQRLRAVALLNGYCTPKHVADLLASPSLQRLRTDWIACGRARMADVSLTWAIETQSCSSGWLNDLFTKAGRQFSLISIDGHCPSALAMLCPQVRSLALKPASCQPMRHEIPTRKLEAIRMWCECGGWKHLAALLATDVRSIELGWARGRTNWPTGDVSDLVGIIHDAAPQHHISYWEATSECVAVRDALRRPASIETVRQSSATRTDCAEATPAHLGSHAVRSAAGSVPRPVRRASWACRRSGSFAIALRPSSLPQHRGPAALGQGAGRSVPTRAGSLRRDPTVM